MQVRFHVAASAAAAAAAYAVSESAVMAGAALASGILIDADHLIDYVAFHRPPYGVRHLLDIYYNGRLTHVLLPLHAWELVIFLALAAAASQWPPLTTGLLIGIGHHVLLDQIFNKPYPLGYFLSYRLYCRLAFNRCFRKPAGPLPEKKAPDSSGA